jgi:hypothetical protein
MLGSVRVTEKLVASRVGPSSKKLVSSYYDSVLHSEDGILPYRSTYLRVIQFTKSLLVNSHLSFNLSILLLVSYSIEIK